MFELSPAQAESLAAARIGHLATASADGLPHVIPVCFALHGPAIYSVLDLKPKRTSLTRLRRVRNIQANSQVALVVDHYDEDWGRLWYILLTGHAELLLDGEERSVAVEILRQKYRQYREMPIDPNPVIKISLTSVVSWDAGA